MSKIFVSFSLIATLLIISMSCQSTKLLLKSNPVGATIELYDGDTDSFVKLGKTPLEIDLDSAQPGLSEGAMRISHPNYVPERFFLDWQAYSSYELKLKLKKLTAKQMANVARVVEKQQPRKAGKLRIVKHGVSRKRANEFAKVVVQVQRHVDAQELGPAMQLVKGAIKKDPMIAIFWDLKGSIHLLKGEKADARASFKRSLKLDPKNPDTLSVLTGLEKG